MHREYKAVLQGSTREKGIGRKSERDEMRDDNVILLKKKEEEELSKEDRLSTEKMMTVKS